MVMRSPCVGSCVLCACSSAESMQPKHEYVRSLYAALSETLLLYAEQQSAICSSTGLASIITSIEWVASRDGPSLDHLHDCIKCTPGGWNAGSSTWLPVGTVPHVFALGTPLGVIRMSVACWHA